MVVLCQSMDHASMVFALRSWGSHATRGGKPSLNRVFTDQVTALHTACHDAEVQASLELQATSKGLR
jgi:hypothetical protein